MYQFWTKSIHWFSKLLGFILGQTDRQTDRHQDDKQYFSPGGVGGHNYFQLAAALGISFLHLASGLRKLQLSPDDYML